MKRLAVIFAIAVLVVGTVALSIGLTGCRATQNGIERLTHFGEEQIEEGSNLFFKNRKNRDKQRLDEQNFDRNAQDHQARARRIQHRTINRKGNQANWNDSYNNNANWNAQCVLVRFCL